MIDLSKIKTIVKILLCVIWLTLIFYNCTRQGEVSQSNSEDVVNVVSTFVNIPLENKDSIGIKFSDANFYVRKNAHFFEYLIFSMLLCAAVRQFKLYKSSEIFLLLFLLLFFPVLDEFIQKYIPERTSSIFDVVIDLSGGISGMLISYYWVYNIKKVKRRCFYD